MTKARGLGRTVRAGGAGLALALLPAALAGQEIRYSGSLGYATGDYIFTQRTSSASLLNGISARWGRFGTYLSVPVLMQNSDAVTWIHGGPLPTGGPANASVDRRRDGEPIRMGRRDHAGAPPAGDSVFVTAPGDLRVRMGDPVLSGTVEIFQGYSTLRSIELQARAKAPLTDIDSGIGSGAWDFGIGSTIAMAAGPTIVFLDAAWWWLGDMPDLELVDYLDFGAGIGIPVDERWTVLASLAGATRIIEDVDPPASLSVSIARRIRSGASLNLGAGFGLTESAADFTAFVGWGFTLRSARDAT